MRILNRPEFLDPVIREADGMTMVYVPAGSFKMGAPWWMQLDPLQRTPGAYPRHKVTLDAFWIDQTEVTVVQWETCVSAGACDTCPTRPCATTKLWSDDLPVRRITWYEAATYCTWAGGQLPTEAQWEYAARGPDNRRYPWGYGAPSCEEVAHDGCEPISSRPGPAPVGSYPAGASWVGALDMAGSVGEFVADWSAGAGNYYAVSPRNNPTGPASGERKLWRGGWEGGRPYLLRTFMRYAGSPDEPSDIIGFRCVAPAES